MLDALVMFDDDSDVSNPLYYMLDALVMFDVIL